MLIKVPHEVMKTSGFALGFQHLPRDLANVNEWKIMFDPYINDMLLLNIIGLPANFLWQSWFVRENISRVK